MNLISWADFARIDMRVGTIVAVKDFPEARKPAYQLTVDLGPGLGMKKTSAQITVNYTRETLVGKQVICIVNFPPKQIGNFVSEILITGFPDSQGNIVLAQPAATVPNGAKIG